MLRRLRLLILTVVNIVFHRLGFDARPIDDRAATMPSFPDGVLPRVATVIDVGAHVGEFAHAVLRRDPSVAVIAFEPVPRSFATLRLRLSKHKAVETHAVAIGDADGTTVVHVHAFTACSSILGPDPALRRHFPYAGFSRDHTVPIRRLDSILGDRRIARPALLKVDVQGYEDRVLRGASSTLRRVDAIVIETSDTILYRDQVLRGHIIEWLSTHGFRYAGPIHKHHSYATGRAVQEDSLFLRHPPLTARPR